jgi:hypothetical protein
MLRDSGFADVVTGEPVDTFGGAKGQDNARAFDVYGYAFMARRPVPNDPRWRRLQPDTAAIRRFRPWPRRPGRAVLPASAARYCMTAAFMQFKRHGCGIHAV